MEDGHVKGFQPRGEKISNIQHPTFNIEHPTPINSDKSRVNFGWTSRLKRIRRLFVTGDIQQFRCVLAGQAPPTL
jgi:hypothetical protein